MTTDSSAAPCLSHQIAKAPPSLLHTNIGGKTPVSIVSLGIMGMSEFYGNTDETESLATIREALDSGINWVDTADSYGVGKNEELLAKVLRERPRDQVFVATKFGPIRDEKGNLVGFSGAPDYVEKACDASLKRLGVEYIDLYYLHRVDPNTPIEDTVRAMGELVKKGKVRYLGLSEVSAETLKRAHAVHPIAAVQSEYSLWTLDPENGVLEATKEIGALFVAYSPLGRGFLTGKYKSIDDFEPNDFRRFIPRFQGDNFQKNLQLVEELQELAKGKNVTASQIAIAWLLSRGTHVIPLFGTKRREYLRENLKGAFIHLSPEDLERIDGLLKKLPIQGERYHASQMTRVDK